MAGMGVTGNWGSAGRDYNSGRQAIRCPPTSLPRVGKAHAVRSTAHQGPSPVTLSCCFTSIMAVFEDLPPEVLVSFLETLLGEVIHPKDHQHQLGSVLLVCKNWQEVAEAAPSLWNVVSSDQSKTWVGRVLEKSGDTGLYVRFVRGTENAHTSGWFPKLVLPLIHRWSDLLLDWPLNMFGAVPPGAPILDLLWNTIIYPERDSGSGEEEVTIETPTFSSVDKLPRVRALTLQAQESFGWLWPLLGDSLQHLSIHRGGDPKLSMQDFLDVLAGCPNLVSLSLRGTAFKDKIAINPDQRVVLPNLTHFHYYDVMPQVPLVLAVLDLPAAIKYTIIVTDGERSTWGELLTILGPILSRVLEQDGKDNLEPIPAAIDSSVGWRLALASGSFRLGVDSPEWDFLSMMLSAFKEQLSTIPVAFLWFFSPREYGLLGAMDDLNDKLRTIVHLRIPRICPGVRGVIGKLMEKDPHAEAEDDNRMFFPELSVLEVMELDGKGEGPEEDKISAHFSRLMDARSGGDPAVGKSSPLLHVQNRYTPPEEKDGFHELSRTRPNAFTFTEAWPTFWWDTQATLYDHPYDETWY